MPIDASLAVGATLPPLEFSWTSSDVMLYHLALGAGADPADPRELRYTTEPELHVLPTFAVVAPSLLRTDPPKLDYPGVSVDLAHVLHGEQRIEVYRPIEIDDVALARTRVVDVWDKGSAAVIVTETRVETRAGVALWMSRSSTFVRGEGGFGGERGPSGTTPLPERPPDREIVTPTLPQQALWYRLLGDRNPLHSSPSFARRAGFDRPVLHGLCTYGMVAKAVVDTMLHGAVERLAAFEARFSGVVFPGETLRTSVWTTEHGYLLRTTVDEREGATALSYASAEIA